jgi:glycolate oxidase FAD binding subunit
MDDTLRGFAEILRQAAADRTPVRLRGGGTKDFYGRPVAGETLATGAYRGVVDYEPSELVVTARAGTPLAELEAELAASGQMLPFEPPHFGAGATLGGCVAAGLSGPRRPYAGALRDFVLGVRVLDGRGQDLAFGGRVMKNVAGYDVARLLAGSLGTLGLIAEVSLKVLPRPSAETTLQLELPEPEAIETMNRWGGKPLPITATCYGDGALRVRLAGSENGVRAAREKIGGEELPEGAAFWTAMREQSHAFFAGADTLWRLSVKPTAATVELAGRQIIEWGGALRWWVTDAPEHEVRGAAIRAGGHATLFRGARPGQAVFAPLTPPLARIHERLKKAFDPAGILNPGRMYPEL